MKRMRLVVGAAFFSTALVCIAGTPAWWNVWIFLAYMAVLGWFTSKRINSWPGLAEERRTASARAKSWDLVPVRLINLALPAMLVTAALEARFRWFAPVPVGVSAAAFAGMTFTAVITYRAIAANAFFSSHMRIQKDRGHTVVCAGPYRVVRHPGYAGAMLFNLLAPLALGSWTATGFGAGTAVLLIYRTSREDSDLAAELPGYAEYAQQVRHRLIPGLW